MFETYSLAIFFSLLGGLGSLLGGVFLLDRLAAMKNLVVHLVSFAAGALLAAAFADILPEAIEHGPGDPSNILFATLIGFTLFFLLEGAFLWFHHHEGYRDLEDNPCDHPERHAETPVLLTIGDSVHNFIDGIAIGAAFLVDVPTGIVTSIAVAAHEIPHEMGDFAVMLHAGWPKRKVLLSNILSALLAVIGTALTLVFHDAIEPYVGYLLGLTAGFFLYIGASDLVPEIYRTSRRDKLTHVALLFTLGIALIVGARFLLEH